MNKNKEIPLQTCFSTLLKPASKAKQSEFQYWMGKSSIGKSAILSSENTSK